MALLMSWVNIVYIMYSFPTIILNVCKQLYSSSALPQNDSSDLTCLSWDPWNQDRRSIENGFYLLLLPFDASALTRIDSSTAATSELWPDCWEWEINLLNHLLWSLGSVRHGECPARTGRTLNTIFIITFHSSVMPFCAPSSRSR